MIFLSKLWFGKYSLLKTYWIYCVLIPILLSIPIKLWKEDSFTSLFFYLCLISSYSFIALIGLWRSSNSYVGNITWSLLARFIVIIGFISQFFLMLQTMLVNINYPIWYFILVGSILLIFYNLVKDKELLYSENTNINEITKKEAVDENNLWEQVAREFEFSRNEGLWTRFFVENNGDENKAKVKYLAFRFNELKVIANSNLSPSSNIVKTGLNSPQVDIYIEESKNEKPKPPTLITYIQLILTLIAIPFFFVFLASVF